MKKVLLTISFLLVGIATIYSIAPDPANYNSFNDYELRNLWFQSYNLGNLSSSLCPVENNARSMAVLNGEILICRRDGSAEPFTASIDIFDGATGNFIRNQPLASNVFKDINGTQVLYVCNDIRVDDAGHVLVCNLSTDNTKYIFQIWRINLTDGTGTKVLDYLKGGTGSFRFDSFDVYGDVTGNGYIISANGSGANVFRWEISNGVVANTPNFLAINSFYPTNATSFGVESRILAIDNKRFYLDGKSIFPTLYSYDNNLTTISLLSSFGDDITNKPTSTNRNGMDMFTINNRTFLSYANTDPSNPTTPDPMKFKLIELGSNMSFLGSTNYFDYPGSINGLYKKTSNRWLQTVYSEVNAAGTVATLYLYGPQYGLAAYKFGLTQHLDQLGAGDYRSVALVPATAPVITATFSSGTISAINVTSGGSGFTDGAVVTIKGTTGGFAVFKAEVVGGVITAVNVNSIVSGLNSGFGGSANVLVSGATNWSSGNWQVLSSDLMTWTNTTNPPTTQNISIVPGHCVAATGSVTCRNLTVGGSLMASGEINVAENLQIPTVSGGIRGYVKMGGTIPQLVSVNGNTLDSLNVANISGVTLSGSVKMNTLNVSAGAKLTNSGSLSTTSFTIKSSINGTGTYVDNGTNNVTGSTKVQQCLTSGRNWYLSSPVTGALTTTINSITGSSVLSYDETHGSSAPWVTENSSLTPGKGYVIVSPVNTNPTITFNGALNTGNQTVLLTRTVGQTKEGFNLVGNPYPSFVNGRTAINSNPNLDKTIWYRTKDITNTMYYFDTYNTLSNIGTNNNGYREVTGTIPPMQAVWVRVSEGQSGATLSFNNNLRSHKNDTINPLKVSPLTNPAQQVLRLQVSNDMPVTKPLFVLIQKH